MSQNNLANGGQTIFFRTKNTEFIISGERMGMIKSNFPIVFLHGKNAVAELNELSPLSTVTCLTSEISRKVGVFKNVGYTAC